MKTAGRIRSAVTAVTAGGYLYMVLAVAAAACLLDPTGPAEVPGIVMLGGLAVVAAVGLYWYLTGRMTAGRLITLLIAAGFVLRLGYTLYTGAQQRQHDVEQFGGGVGHAGYIEYLYEHFSLPPGDPTATWQFYHPPLHHWLAACCMRLVTACGGSYQRAVESIQYLTLLYSGFCMLLCRRLFELLGLRGRGAVAAMGVVCFYPAFILLAGSVNNDILSVTLMLAALVTALQWWQEPTLPRILAVALCIGAGMSAKLSAVLVAPAVALLFLWRWRWPAPAEPLRRPTAQFGAFAAVCFPLGLWWSVRNLIGWRVFPGYVPMLSQDNWLYIGGYSVWQRLFGWIGYPMKTVFISYGLKQDYLDYNPIIALLKTAMFGEYDLAAGRPWLLPACVALFALGTLLALYAVWAMLWCLIRDGELPRPYKWFTACLYGTVLFSYVQFCLTYAHACTQNIRYAMVLPVLGCFFIGRRIQALCGAGKRVRGWFLVGLCAAFCILAAAVYIGLGV